jgi:hypothetical protein
MCAAKKYKQDSDKAPQAAMALSSNSIQVLHARRNGHLYRSTDGVTWLLETDPDILAVEEGTTKVSVTSKP